LTISKATLEKVWEACSNKKEPIGPKMRTLLSPLLEHLTRGRKHKYDVRVNADTRKCEVHIRYPNSAMMGSVNIYVPEKIDGENSLYFFSLLIIELSNRRYHSLAYQLVGHRTGTLHCRRNIYQARNL
jgi:hypothetical protein